MNANTLAKAITIAQALDSDTSTPCCIKQPGRRQIVVGQRGFVWVGIVHEDGDYLIINPCSCVRRWGTTKGLGELASKGPQKDTVLDPQPSTRLHRLTSIQQIDCEESAWSSK